MKLKKSLLIVPAMATMLLAAAGSVGGTVAWFSANTTFDTEISSFKVVRLDGDLECTMAAGTGTTLTGSTISVTTNSELTHGSFDHNSGNVYTKIGTNNYVSRGTVASSDGTVSGGTGLVAGSYTVSSTTHTVYHAVTWSMTFTYRLPVAASSATNTNLYFDLANSAVTVRSTDTNESELKETSKGFRLAFYPQTSNKTGTNTQQKHVWADLQTSDKCKYVKLVDETPTPNTAYTTSELLDSSASESIATQPSGPSDKNYCLGQFIQFDGGVSSISFTCVAWFEGEDENVVNASKMQTVKAGLAFYTLPNA